MPAPAPCAKTKHVVAVDRTVEPRGNGRSSRNRNLTHRRVRLEVSGFFHALAFEKRLAWSIPGV